MTQGDIVSEVVVVTGYDHPLIERALDGLRLRFANNPNWPKGIGSSIAVGASALGPNLDGGLIMPGDMPLVPAALLRAADRGVRSSAGSIDHLSRDRFRRTAQSGFVAAAVLRVTDVAQRAGGR